MLLSASPRWHFNHALYERIRSSRAAWGLPVAPKMRPEARHMLGRTLIDREKWTLLHVTAAMKNEDGRGGVFYELCANDQFNGSTCIKWQNITSADPSVRQVILSHRSRFLVAS